MPKTTFYTSHKMHLELGLQIGSGGEGDVFEVRGNADLVAKIYHVPPNEQKAAKLKYMATHQDKALNRIAAWVSQVLYADPDCTQLVGFVMPRVHKAHPIHQLYNTKSRKQIFPNADWKFLVHTALNVANAFAVVHVHGHTIGDVNHSSIFVKADATVMLIDCDSFEINTPDTSFPCEVGVPEFTPPELQNKAFHTIDRSANHDNFGLAALIFHLLFLGRHPFSGVFLGNGDMPLLQAISEKRFAYGKHAKTRKMQPPPFTMLFEALPDDMEQMFNHAFLEIENRPQAEIWVKALTDLQQSLKTCEDNPSHHFPPDAKTCPWCDIEKGTNSILFKGFFGTEISKLSDFKLPKSISFSEDIEVKPTQSIIDLKKQLRSKWILNTTLNVFILISVLGMLGGVIFYNLPTTSVEITPNTYDSGAVVFYFIILVFIGLFQSLKLVSFHNYLQEQDIIPKIQDHHFKTKGELAEFTKREQNLLRRIQQFQNEVKRFESLMGMYETTSNSAHKKQLETLKKEKNMMQMELSEFSASIYKYQNKIREAKQAEADYDHLYNGIFY